MAGKTIALSRRYEAFGKALDRVELREPTFEDLFTVGEVQEWQPVPGGDGSMLITHDDRIRAYAERLAGADAAAVLPQLGLADALKVKRAVIDFFAEARTSIAPPTTSPSASGSASTS